MELQPTSTYPPVIGLDELSKLLRKSRSSILSDRTRARHRLPPACTPPDSKTLLWITEDAIAWLRQHQEQVVEPPAPSPSDSSPPELSISTPRRGAPSKEERLAAMAAGLTVREFRRQRRDVGGKL